MKTPTTPKIKRNAPRKPFDLQADDDLAWGVFLSSIAMCLFLVNYFFWDKYWISSLCTFSFGLGIGFVIAGLKKKQHFRQSQKVGSPSPAHDESPHHH